MALAVHSDEGLMGASARQLRLMGSRAWFVRPSTARTGFGVPTDSSGRYSGPYPARLTGSRALSRGTDGAGSSPGGTLIVATTVAPSTMTHAVVVSSSTDRLSGATFAVASVTLYRDAAGGLHHVTANLGNAP